MTRRTLASLMGAVLTAALMLFVVSSADAHPSPSRPPLPPPGAFGGDAINPYFPLVPGTTNIYTGSIDGVPARESFAVTKSTKVVDGIPATVIRDSLYLQRESGNGMYLAEFTIDWYATADSGDVWYLGEATAEYDEAGNVVSTAGSWQSGVDGARAGIFMPAKPRVGDVFQQEIAADAQDFFKITAVNEDRITTTEWTPLEPQVATKKVFARGVGMVLEDTIKGAGVEDLFLQLVAVTHS